MTVTVSGGEYYYVSCPECGDTRGRLEFNYLWATRDPRTRTELLHVVCCFNERCFDNYEMQRALADKLLPNRSLIFPNRRRHPTPQQAVPDAPAPALIPTELPEPPPPQPIQLPEGFVAGKSRIRSARARNYLEQRGFDPRELETRWDVGYCRESSSPRPAFSDRLVIPVYTLAPNLASGGGEPEAVLAGWQARAVGDVSHGEKKYLAAAGMKKSHLLYGLPQAVTTEGPIVICEGATGVWRLKTNGIAIFGKSMSPHQRALILRYFPNRPLVVFLDPDAEDEAREAVQALRLARMAADDSSQVVIASPPDGREDIGDCRFEEAWRQVADALRVPRGKLLRRVKRAIDDR